MPRTPSSNSEAATNGHHEQPDGGQRRSVGVIVERRDTDTPRTETRWQPTALIPPSPDRPAWSIIDGGPGWTRYYAGTAEIALYPGKVENYRQNLDGGRPMAYVILRRNGDRAGVSLLAVTVDPGTIGTPGKAGDALIEALPLPSALALWMDGFVARYGVARPLHKRSRMRERDDG